MKSHKNLLRLNSIIMRRTIIFIFICLNLFLNNVNATDLDSSSGDWDSFYENIWGYDGQIGPYKIRMLLLFHKNNSIEGLYIYRYSKKEIKIVGHLKDHKIDLTEKDDKNQAVAIFDGSFRSCPYVKPEDILAISGKWQNLKSKKILPFKVSGKIPYGRSFDHLYSATCSTFDNDELINKAALAFQNAIKNNDKVAVSKMISYPIEVHISTDVMLTRKVWKVLKNPQDLLRNYNFIFNEKNKNEILDEFPRLMWPSIRDAAVSGVGVWFNSDGKIITLPEIRRENPRHS